MHSALWCTAQAGGWLAATARPQVHGLQQRPSPQRARRAWKVPICVQPISSSADSNTRRTGTAWMRARSHSTCRARAG